MDMTLDEVIAFKKSTPRRGRGRGRGRGAGRGGGTGAGGAPGGPQKRTWKSRGKGAAVAGGVRTRAQQRIQQSRQKARSNVIDARRRLSGGAVATSTPVTTPTSQRGKRGRGRGRGRGPQGNVSKEGSRLKIVRMRGRGGKLSSKIKLIRTLKKDQSIPTVRGRGSGRGRGGSRGRGFRTRPGQSTVGRTPVATPQQDQAVSSPLFMGRSGVSLGTRGGRGRGRGRGMGRPITSLVHPGWDENGSGGTSIKISVPQDFEVEPEGVDLPLDFAASHHTSCSLHSRFSAVRSPQRLVLPNGRSVTYHT